MKNDRKVYMKTYQKVYYQAHKEQMKAKDKAWRLAHPVYGKTYRSTHREELWTNVKVYRQTLKGKTSRKKTSAARRQFGFIPLNKYFEGAESHHINKEQIIYIPKELHRSIWHSISQNMNMEEINTLAFEFFKSNLKHTKSIPKATGAMSVGKESSSSVGGALYCA